MNKMKKKKKKFLPKQSIDLPLSYIHEAFLILNNVLLLVPVAEHAVTVQSSRAWCYFVAREMRRETAAIEPLVRFPEADRLGTMVPL